MTDNIDEKIKDNYLLGCIKYQSNFNFYLMPLAYWILNYSKYDPTYNPNDWGFVFRNNILNVDDLKIESFIKSIQIDKVDIESLNFKDYNFDDIFLFFIDFDSKTFVSFFDDIEIEEYLPDENWKGKFENPINYLPSAFRIYFQRCK